MDDDEMAGTSGLRIKQFVMIGAVPAGSLTVTAICLFSGIVVSENARTLAGIVILLSGLAMAITIWAAIHSALERRFSIWHLSLAKNNVAAAEM